MKIRSAILTEMSGKLGGAVGSTARGGIQYLRKLVIPHNPDSFMQKSSRNAISSAAVYWRSIFSDADRESWWDAADAGQTGQGQFTKINQPRIFANNSGRVNFADTSVTALAVITIPPVTMSTTFSGVTVVIDDSANTLTVTGWNPLDQWLAEAAGGKPGLLYVYASHQQQSSRFSRQHPYVLVGVLATDTDTPTDPFVINLAALGMTTAVGEVMYVKTRVQDSHGGISTSSEQRVVIVA